MSTYAYLIVARRLGTAKYTHKNQIQFTDKSIIPSKHTATHYNIVLTTNISLTQSKAERSHLFFYQVVLCRPCMAVSRPDLHVNNFLSKITPCFVTNYNYIVKTRQMSVFCCESTESPTSVTLCYNSKSTFKDNKDVLHNIIITQTTQCLWLCRIGTCGMLTEQNLALYDL